MTRTIVIHGGTVITHDARLRADVVIRGEQVAAIMADASEIDADERIDATGLLVLPGGIDVHTHFREPEEGTREGFLTGSYGAAAGGVTTVVEMPQATPTTVNAEQFRAKRDRVGVSAIIDIALWGGVIGAPAQDAETIAELARNGAAAFKSFMASSSPSFPAVDHNKLLWAMKEIAKTGLPYGLHAEDDNLVLAGLAAMQSLGRTDPMAHAESRPPLVEAVAVNTAIFLAEQTGCWIYICHCASADALALIADAKDRGLSISVETCPQYLTLTTDDLVARKGFARCAPALRSPEEVNAIWEYVLDETIDVISSDHCGFTAEQKAKGEENIFDVPMGLAGIQTIYPDFWDAAVNQRAMDATQFVRQIATTPAMIFGLYPRKGTIAVGSDADIVIFDPDKPWVVRGEEMLHKQKWTTWEGKTITGRVLRTIRRGETIYDDRLDGMDRLPAAAGSGRFLPRGYGGEGLS